MLCEQLVFGTDPEFFIRDKERGIEVSPHPYVKGDKKAPVPLSERTNVQLDGFAVEVGIAPAETPEQFWQYIQQAEEALRTKVLPENLEISDRTSVIFERDVFFGAPEKSRELGCDPDFDPYSVHPFMGNPEPYQITGDNRDRPFRTAGGHLHLGWIGDGGVPIPTEPYPAQHWGTCTLFARALDVLLAVPSLLIHDDPERRLLYGKPGAFRPKPYGMEYRVLSNFWVRDPSLIRWVLRRASRTWEILRGDDQEFKSRLTGPDAAVARNILTGQEGLHEGILRLSRNTIQLILEENDI